MMSRAVVIGSSSSIESPSAGGSVRPAYPDAVTRNVEVLARLTA